MRSRTLLPTLAGAAIGAVLFNARPALADLPVFDFAVDGAIGLLQTAVTDAVTNIGTQISNTVTQLDTDVSQLLTNGFTQEANYAKAQVGAQQQIADAQDTAMARFDRDLRNAQIRDEQTPSPQACLAIDDGQSVAAASAQSWSVAAAIANVTDPRGEAGPNTPAFYGQGQASGAAGALHFGRYCSQTEQQAGLCTLSQLQNADQRAGSLFGTDTYPDQNGVNAANDFATMLIQPVAPAALRGDQLTSVNGQDAVMRRRSYNARMSLARSVLSYAIGLQTPSVVLTAQQQQEMQNEGLQATQNGSWMQAVSLEVNRRLDGVTWAASLQAMPPAAVEREIAIQLALGNYLAVQNFRVQLFNAVVSAAHFATTEERSFLPTTEMPTLSMAGN